MHDRSADAPASPVDAVAALLGVLAVAMPVLRFGFGAGLYDSQRLAVVALFVAAAAAALTPSGRAALGRAAWRPALSLAVGAALAWGVLSAVQASMPVYGLAEVGQVAILLAVAALFAGHWGREGARPFVEGLVLAAAASYAVSVLVAHGLSVADGRAGWPFATTGGFANRRFLNQAQLVMLPVLLALAARTDAATWRRWAARGLAAVHVGMLIGSGGRAAAVGLVVGLAVAGALVGRRMWGLWREAGMAGAVGAAVYAAIFVWAVAEPGDPYARAELVGSRALHFGAALRIAADHPLFGVGPMHYAALATPGAVHPHNAALQLAAEWGLPAAAGMVGAVAIAVGLAVRSLRGAGDRALWRAALLAALVAALGSAVVDSVVMAPSSQVWAIVLAAALWAEVGRGAAPRSGAVGWALALVAVLAVAPVVAVVAADAPTLGERASARSEWLSPRRAHPRFWQVGTIAPPEGPPAETARYWEGSR